MIGVICKHQRAVTDFELWSWENIARIANSYPRTYHQLLRCQVQLKLLLLNYVTINTVTTAAVTTVTISTVTI